MKNKYRVTYNSAKNGTFTVHKPDAQLHFVMHQDGLHYHNTKNCEVTLIHTVQDNEEGYSKTQIKDAQEACDLYAEVGYPSPKDFQNLISENIILNCPVTVEDVIRADKIYGRDINSLKGKTTRTWPTRLILIVLKSHQV